jgi:eukaryotic-like serine/threonine-protein kinase
MSNSSQADPGEAALSGASTVSHGSLPFQLPDVGSSITSPITGNTYTIGNHIGEGGFGVVFDCSDVWGNELAAKVLKPNGTDFGATEERARAELEALVAVRHPNIVHVYDAFVYHGACYIVSERCDLPLTTFLDDSQYQPLTWFRSIARCVLQAVHFAHVQGLAHCDIHLGNVFSKFIKDEVVPDKFTAATFKLGDFGLARASSAVTADGTFLESIRPPEAIDSNEFGPSDHRIDIYHVGLLLLQAYHGKPMTFTRDEILQGVPRERALELPAPYSFALEKTLRRHVVYRTSTAMEIWRDLNSPVGS